MGRALPFSHLALQHLANYYGYLFYLTNAIFPDLIRILCRNALIISSS